MTTHLFDKIDSPCCANFALKKRTVHNVDSNLSVIKAKENDFYMDDFLKSHSSIKYFTYIIKPNISNLKNAGFRLTKFTSNN